jgi:hypothetical protein
MRVHREQAQRRSGVVEGNSHDADDTDPVIVAVTVAERERATE